MRLSATGADVEDPAQVAAQIPAAREVEPGSVVAVEALAVQKRGLLQRVLGDKKVPVSRVVRCSALLARGYVDIEAEGDEVWGTA